MAERVRDPGDGVLDLRSALRDAWGNLPVLLVGSALVTVAVLAAVVAARAGTLAGAMVGLIAVPPTLMSLVATSLDILGEEEPTVHAHGARILHLAPRAIGICALPTVLAGLTQVALFAYGHGGGAVMLVPAALGATTTVLSLVGAVVMLPMRAGAGGPTGGHAWLYALHLFARTPVPYLAAVVVGGLGVWMSLTISNGLFVLVPAPFTLVLAAAFRAAETSGR